MRNKRWALGLVVVVVGMLGKLISGEVNVFLPETGAASWEAPWHWSLGRVPEASDEVVIPGPANASSALVVTMGNPSDGVTAVDVTCYSLSVGRPEGVIDSSSGPSDYEKEPWVVWAANVTDWVPATAPLPVVGVVLDSFGLLNVTDQLTVHTSGAVNLNFPLRHTVVEYYPVLRTPTATVHGQMFVSGHALLEVDELAVFGAFIVRQDAVSRADEELVLNSDLGYVVRRPTVTVTPWLSDRSFFKLEEGGRYVAAGAVRKLLTFAAPWLESLVHLVVDQVVGNGGVVELILLPLRTVKSVDFTSREGFMNVFPTCVTLKDEALNVLSFTGRTGAVPVEMTNMCTDEKLWWLAQYGEESYALPESPVLYTNPRFGHGLMHAIPLNQNQVPAGPLSYGKPYCALGAPDCSNQQARGCAVRGDCGSGVCSFTEGECFMCTTWPAATKGQRFRSLLLPFGEAASNSDAFIPSLINVTDLQLSDELVGCGGPLCPGTCGHDATCESSVDCAGGVRMKGKSASLYTLVEYNCHPTENVCFACNDNRRSSVEGGTDCGGACSTECGLDSFCKSDSDCEEGYGCFADGGKKYCRQANDESCRDNVKNNLETAIDCGGPLCEPCQLRRACVEDRDCKEPYACDQGVCGGCSYGDDEVCRDGVKSCSKCPCEIGFYRPTPDSICVTVCDNGKVDEEYESDIDCGGICEACSDGKRCNVATDCTSGICDPVTNQCGGCADGVRNGFESDVDCGGKACSPCSLGQVCRNDYDCAGTNDIPSLCSTCRELLLGDRINGLSVCEGNVCVEGGSFYCEKCKSFSSSVGGSSIKPSARSLICDDDLCLNYTCTDTVEDCPAGSACNSLGQCAPMASLDILYESAYQATYMDESPLNPGDNGATQIGPQETQDVESFATACTSVDGGGISTTYGQSTTCSYTCPSGWTGGNCDIPECPVGGPQGTECSGRGYCSTLLDPPYCDCDSPYIGPACEQIDCPGTPDCKGRGSCSVQESTAVCVCEPGWDGVQCEIPVCDGGCGNHGVCVGDDGTPACLCDPGYAGATCEQLCDPPCVVGQGQCSLQEDRAVCQCYSGADFAFGGEDCSQFSCRPDCGPHGQCDTVGRQCVCNLGWDGPSCADLACPVSADCSGNGECVVGGDGVVACACDEGFAGEGCEVMECPGACSGNGRCERLDGGAPVCLCDAGFFGTDCSGVGVCHNNCGGGTRGTCVADVCECTFSFTGSDCSEPRCEGECSFAGECVVSGETSVCDCYPGYSGSQCGEPLCLPECEHGICSGRGGGREPQCLCEDFYEGADCSDCRRGDGSIEVRGYLTDAISPEDFYNEMSSLLSESLKSFFLCLQEVVTFAGGSRRQSAPVVMVVMVLTDLSSPSELAAAAAVDDIILRGVDGVLLLRRDVTLDTLSVCDPPCEAGGICVREQCLCSPQATGSRCEFLQCPGNDLGVCSLHGDCQQGPVVAVDDGLGTELFFPNWCVCDDAWEGDDCGTVAPDFCPSECNYPNGVCNTSTGTPFCVCAPTHIGSDCSAEVADYTYYMTGSGEEWVKWAMVGLLGSGVVVIILVVALYYNSARFMKLVAGEEAHRVHRLRGFASDGGKFDKRVKKKQLLP